MITKCYSSSNENPCPCTFCAEECCLESTDNLSFTDTEKLCDIARDHCERCANEYKQKEGCNQ